MPGIQRAFTTPFGVVAESDMPPGIADRIEVGTTVTETEQLGQCECCGQEITETVRDVEYTDDALEAIKVVEDIARKAFEAG